MNFIEKLPNELAKVQQRCNARLLCVDRDSHIIAMGIDIFEALISIPDSVVLVEINGGAVANSYKYRGESTWIRLSRNNIHKTPEMTISRGSAPVRPHGRCWSLRVTYNGKYLIRI